MQSNPFLSPDSMSLDISTLPPDFKEVDLHHSTSSDFFCATDLPLRTFASEYAHHPISLSGESSYQSAPGLTTGSSEARSDAGEAYSTDGAGGAFSWSESMSSAVPMSWSSTANAADIGAVDMKLRETIVAAETMARSPNLAPHLTGTGFSSAAAMLASSGAGGAGMVNHEHRVSESSSSSGGTAKASSASHGRDVVDLDEDGEAIFIPTDQEETVTVWNWNSPVPPVEMSKEFGWLVDP